MDSGRLKIAVRSSYLTVVVALLLISGIGCVTSKMDTASGGNQGAAGNLSVGPSTFSFGNVTVGGSKDQAGSLSAASGGVTVQTASWSGTGFSVSGISFPMTIAAGQSVPFTVTFAPQVTGATTGTISFFSDAANTPGNIALSETGVQSSQHRVTLDWNPSSSSVQGYYVYRSTATGGPYTRLSPLETGLSYVDTAVTSGQT
jgi:hypothetical protein